MTGGTFKRDIEMDLWGVRIFVEVIKAVHRQRGKSKGGSRDPSGPSTRDSQHGGAFEERKLGPTQQKGVSSCVC